jgi:hypothetical protein
MLMRNTILAAAYAARSAVAALVWALIPTVLHGGIISHGDFTAPSVSFLDVEETTPGETATLVGLPAVAGNSLLFLPPNTLQVVAIGGEQDHLDLFIEFSLSASPGSRLTGINLSETGTFLYSGNILGSTTAIEATASVVVTIEEIDGVSNTSIPASDPISQTTSPTVLATPAFGGLWTLDLFFDIQDQLDASMVSYAFGVTRVSVQVNFGFDASAHVGNSILIGLSMLRLEAFAEDAPPPVPEPTTFVLTGLALAMLGASRTFRHR